MLNGTDTALLMVGNQAVRLLKADRMTQEMVPKGSWEVSYTVENSSLIFSIFLNYGIFYQKFAGVLADPTLWITIVALFTTTAWEEHASTLPQNLRISFIVNAYGNEIKDWMASCTVKELLDARDKTKGKSLDDASTIMMTTMDLDRR